MNTTKITDSEIAKLKVSSLPTRPTAPSSFGGRGYTANDMKAAFDRLPVFIIEKFNSLLDDIISTDSGSLSASVPTGIRSAHTLKILFADIVNGVFSTYLSVGDETLAEMKIRLAYEVEKISEHIAELFDYMNDTVIDAGNPKARTKSGEVIA